MKIKIKRLLSVLLVLVLTAAFPAAASAKESIGNGLILSDDTLTLTEGGSVILTAAMQEGFDASALSCVCADPAIAAVTPIGAINNVANFLVTYVGSGSTVIAVFHPENPAVVAYTAVNATIIPIEAPAKLGTNRDNYCKLIGYEFVPYELDSYGYLNSYKYTLKLQYQCVSYEDDDFSKWGCYGYFYDASGAVISKVHLYCSALSKDRIYHSEFNVPVNAVRFAIEGFS
ncbi:MAG: pilus assembly protein N-terminal domain-containing protein [Roseburia sp.]|nr:pilus assembly protein N-terminal domain-containing protein [Roseburia sp.]